MGKSTCSKKTGLRKGPWTPAEDQKLMAFIQDNGHGTWRTLPAKAGLQRCGKSCRLRWNNYLRPDIKRGKFSLQEEQTIINLHALLGNRWSVIANHLGKRTDNEIKNHWNTHLKKRLTKMGIDPVTHKPKHHNTFVPGSSTEKDAANLSHMTQWENARLEAEARLVRGSKQMVNITTNHHSLKLVNINTSNQSTGYMNKVAATRTPAFPYLDVLKAWQGARWSKATIRDNSYSNMCSGILGELESPTSILDISAYPAPIQAKEFPQLDNTNGVLQEVDASNDCKDSSTTTLNAWFPQDDGTRVSGGISDASNMILPTATHAATNSKIMERFGSTEDMLLYTLEEQNMAAGVISDNVSGVDGGRGHSYIIEDQNKSYWNNILNELVNASPPYGTSSVF